MEDPFGLPDVQNRHGQRIISDSANPLKQNESESITNPRNKLNAVRKKVKDKKIEEKSKPVPNVEEIKLEIASDSEYGMGPANPKHSGSELDLSVGK